MTVRQWLKHGKISRIEEIYPANHLLDRKKFKLLLLDVSMIKLPLCALFVPNFLLIHIRNFPSLSRWIRGN